MTLHVDPRFASFAALANPVAPALRVESERAGDEAAREALLDEAFGAARFAKTSQRLRDGRRPAPGLALVARDGQALVGSVRSWPVAASGAPALLLGPLAVAKSHRSRGVGSRLVRETLARAEALGHRAVLLVGDADYYIRFGFHAGLTERLELPGPVERARFLGLEIEDGALDGAAGMVEALGRRDQVRGRSLRALNVARRKTAPLPTPGFAPYYVL